MACTTRPLTAGCATARAELDRLAGAIPVLELCDQLLAPALRDIGAAWAANTASIAQEHRATAIRRAAAHLSLSHMKGESRGYL